MPGFSLHLARAPDLLFTLLGIFALLIELSYGLILFSRTARRILPVAAFFMHIGIFLFQKLLFFDLVLVQLLFLDVAKIRNAIMRRLGATPKVHVLYDGWCPLCRRTVRVLTAVDLCARLEFLNFRQLDIDAYNGTHGLDLSSRDLEEQMYVISPGRVTRGFASYPALAAVLPVLWPVLPIPIVPRISALGALLYHRVAANRPAGRRCGPGCGIPSAGTLIAMQEPAPPRLWWPFAVSGLIALLLVAWVHRTESYPFSSWQMYAERVGEAVYTQVYARYESGVVSRAYFADAIGALTGGRSLKYLRMCFSPADRPRCEKFLGGGAAAYNRRLPLAGRVTQFEIKQWSWDFRAYPTEPERAALIHYFLFEAPRTAADHR